MSAPVDKVIGKDLEGDPPNCAFNCASVIGMLWSMRSHSWLIGQISDEQDSQSLPNIISALCWITATLLSFPNKANLNSCDPTKTATV